MQSAISLGPSSRHSLQTLVTLASGLLVCFVGFGLGSWFSGVTSWIGFYLGARGDVLVGVAQTAACVGFVLASVVTLLVYRRRCRRRLTEIALRHVLAAFLILPVGNICWAIFVDAIAYHYGQDIVRPAFDLAIMYCVLAGVPLLTVGVPLLVIRWQRDGRAAT